LAGIAPAPNSGRAPAQLARIETAAGTFADIAEARVAVDAFDE
jgi:hypothetical protein